MVFFTRFGGVCFVYWLVFILRNRLSETYFLLSVFCFLFCIGYLGGKLVFL